MINLIAAGPDVIFIFALHSNGIFKIMPQIEASVTNPGAFLQKPASRASVAKGKIPDPWLGAWLVNDGRDFKIQRAH